MQGAERTNSAGYLERIGVRRLPRLTCPFDPGYDPGTLEGHLEQSAHLMAGLKISMACWMVAREESTRQKAAAAKRWNVCTVTGGGPFEIAVAQDALLDYLDLCACIGFARIECGQGFTDICLDPQEVVRMARSRGLEVQFELGKKHGGAFQAENLEGLIDVGRRWLDAGALELIIEARESARGVGVFDAEENFNPGIADRFAQVFGLELLCFEAPTKPSQFALLDHFGPEVRLSNVRLEELLRVEIYRRGLHSDAFSRENLRPLRPRAVA